MIDPTGIANWSVTCVDWSEGKWHPRSYRAVDVKYELLKNITVTILCSLVLLHPICHMHSLHSWILYSVCHEDSEFTLFDIVLQSIGDNYHITSDEKVTTFFFLHILHLIIYQKCKKKRVVSLDSICKANLVQYS